MTIELAGFEYPQGDPSVAPFWAAVAERRLPVARCTSCGRSSMPFGPSCCHCGSSALDSVDACGDGELYTWTVYHRAMDPMFASATPYVVGAVRLAEGATVFASIVDCAPEALAAGLRLELCWRRVAPADLPMWAFRPVEGELHGRHA